MPTEPVGMEPHGWQPKFTPGSKSFMIQFLSPDKEGISYLCLKILAFPQHVLDVCYLSGLEIRDMFHVPVPSLFPDGDNDIYTSWRAKCYLGFSCQQSSYSLQKKKNGGKPCTISSQETFCIRNFILQMSPSTLAHLLHLHPFSILAEPSSQILSLII